MIPPEHPTPEECLPHLAFERNTAGQEDFLRNHGVKFEPTWIRIPGDCAVIAVALAREENYCCARNLLQKRWEIHNPKKTVTTGGGQRSTVMRIAAYVHQKLFNDHDPIWGTPSIVYGNALELPNPMVTLFTGQLPKNDFDMVYGENTGNPVTCLCDPGRAYVIDGYIGEPQEGKHHVTAILQGTVVGNYDIRQANFHVVHIWRSNYHAPSLEFRKELEECTLHRPFAPAE